MEAEQQPNPPRATATLLRKVGWYLGLLAFGGLLFFFVLSEIPQLRRDLRMNRWRSQCEETGRVEPCGRHALWRMRYPDDAEEMAEGFRDLRKVCDGGSNPACFKLIVAMSPAFEGYFSHDADFFDQQVREKAREACVGGQADACFILAEFADLAATEDQNAAARAEAKRLCESGNDFACGAYASLQIQVGGVKGNRDALEAGCAAGFNQHCGRLLDAFGQEEPELAESFQSACAYDRTSDACIDYWLTQVGDEPEHDEWFRQACWDGVHFACRGYLERGRAISDEDSHAETVRAAYRYLGHNDRQLSTFGDIAYWGTKVPELDFEPACDAGHLPACFVHGLSLLNGDDGRWVPDLPPRSELDATLGRACGGGMNAACTAYGARLIDRPLDEVVDRARANALLQKACDDGVTSACWARDLTPRLISDEFDELRDLARRSCRAQTWLGLDGPCRTYAAIRARQLGFAPWVADNRVGMAKFLRLCRTGDARGCESLSFIQGRFHPLRNSAPIRPLTVFDALARTCVGGSAFSCRSVVGVAEKFFGERAVSRQDDLRSRLCEEAPDMCSKIGW